MATDIAIRAATPRDAAAIQAMIAALARETIGPEKEVLGVDEVLRYGFGDEKSFECRVADEGGVVVAVLIMLDEFSTWRGQKGVYVLDIYIAPSARGKGIGRRLIVEAARWGKMRNARYLRLGVDHKNIHAINFYEAIGFEEGARDRMFLLSGEAFEEMNGD